MAPVDPTWTSRDLPVLEAAVRGVDAGRMSGGIRFHEIAAQTGLDVDDVYVAARALEDAGFIENSYVMPGTHSRVTRVSGHARQVAGSWPNEDLAADRVLEAVQLLMASASSDEDRSRLRKLLDALGGVSRDVLVSVASAAITGQMPR